MGATSNNVSFDDFLAAYEEGRVSQDSEGNYLFTDQNGQAYNMSELGLAQMITDYKMSIANSTKNLELSNILAEQYKLPSATEAEVAGNNYNKDMYNAQSQILPSLTDSTISTNQLTTGKNNAELSLIPAWTDTQKSGYELETAQNEMKSGLVDDEGAALASGYKTSIANDNLAQIMAQMGIELTPAQQDYILSQYNLGKATNESNQRLIPSSENAALQANLYNADTASMNTRLNKGLESATSAEYMLKKAQADSGVRTTPFQEAATISKYNYDTAYNQGQTGLLPQRFAATGKFIDESMKGKNVTGAMETASADVASAFKSANEANRRNLSRMGITPNASSFNDSALEMATANVGARSAARRNTEDENYRRLGAVALTP